jgi:hypothetical protein
MPQDNMYTFNPLSNDDKDLLLANGYKPGELPPDEEQELLRDLREQSGDEEGIEPLSDVVMPDEADGAD